VLSFRGRDFVVGQQPVKSKVVRVYAKKATLRAPDDIHPFARNVSFADSEYKSVSDHAVAQLGPALESRLREHG